METMNKVDPSEPAVVELVVKDGDLSGPVLERLISAAASRADLSIDRIVNALAAVDALVDATEHVFAPADERKFSIAISPGKILLAVNALHAEQAERLLGAARLPEIGGVLERMASSVSTEQNGDDTSLVLAFS